MKVSEIVSRVRAAIDELMVNDSGFLSQSSDEKNLDDTIKSKISDALYFVIEQAPLDKLTDDMLDTIPAADMTSKFSIEGSTMIATLELPTDILRVVEARLSSWTQFPKPESNTSQVYLMQSDPYARGSWDRPVNILTYESAKRVLKMYCAKTTADTLEFAYIKKPEVTSTDDTTDITIPTKLESALVYEVAGLTMVAFRDQIAQSLLAIADRYIGIENKDSAA